MDINHITKLVDEASRLASKGIFPLLTGIGVTLIAFALFMKSGVGHGVVVSENLSKEEFLMLIIIGALLPIVGYVLTVKMTHNIYDLYKDSDQPTTHTGPPTRVNTGSR